MIRKLSFWNTLSRNLFLLLTCGWVCPILVKDIEQCKLCKRCELVCLGN